MSQRQVDKAMKSGVVAAGAGVMALGDMALHHMILGPILVIAAGVAGVRAAKALRQ